MGLPLFQAKQLLDLSQVTLFSSNFTLYRDISARVMHVLRQEVGEVDMYSVDEAFFQIDDTTVDKLTALRDRIVKRTGIPVSIGVAKTKTLAKEASEIGKKGDGVCLLTDSEWCQRAPNTPCADIWGLGRATVKKLHELGVRNAAEFMALEKRFVKARFGIGGERIYDELHGVVIYGFDEDSEETRKSVTSSRSFAENTHSLTELQSAIAYHVAYAAKKVRERDLAAAVMYIEARASRHGDFAYRKGTTEIVLDVPTNNTTQLTKLAVNAVRQVYDPQVPYKKAGVILSSLTPDKFVSKTLFETQQVKRDEVLSELLDSVQNRFGFEALHSGAILPSRDRSSVKMRSKAYTTAWGDIPTVRA